MKNFRWNIISTTAFPILIAGVLGFLLPGWLWNPVPGEGSSAAKQVVPALQVGRDFVQSLQAGSQSGQTAVTGIFPVYTGGCLSCLNELFEYAELFVETSSQSSIEASPLLLVIAADPDRAEHFSRALEVPVGRKIPLDLESPLLKSLTNGLEADIGQEIYFLDNAGQRIFFSISFGSGSTPARRKKAHLQEMLRAYQAIQGEKAKQETVNAK